MGRGGDADAVILSGANTTTRNFAQKAPPARRKKRNSSAPRKMNKGEWGEVYTNITLALRIIDLERVELPGCCVVKEGENFFVENKKGRVQVSKEELIKVRSIIFSETKKSKGAFSIPSLKKHAWLKPLLRPAPSTEKTDSIVVIKGSDGKEKRFPLSIKSWIGQNNPSLFNASRESDFTYYISTPGLKEEDKFSEIMRKAKKGSLEFCPRANRTIENNLREIHPKAPFVISEVVKEYSLNKNRSIRDLAEKVASANSDLSKEEVEDIVKDFLLASATGMTAGKKWKKRGRENLSFALMDNKGGIKIVSGHKLRESLFNHAELDFPSKGRLKYGSIIQDENGRECIKLNFQVRLNSTMITV